MPVRAALQRIGHPATCVVYVLFSVADDGDVARAKVVHGDTAITPFSTGTYASRSIVYAGGAVSQACRILLSRHCPANFQKLECFAISLMENR